MLEKNKVRTITLSIFQVIFIVLSYFYLSEAIGSISSPFILNEGFSTYFSGTLLVFGFLSILAGPLQGFCSGFLGELLFQIAFYHEIFFDWCLIIAFIGLACGVYRYSPLKYHNGMKVYYTFLILVITSFIVLFSLFLFQIVIYQNPNDLDTIFINYSFKFLTYSLVSFIFPLPLILILYDRVFARSERIVYNLFLTHHPPNAADHTFYLEFGRTRFYFCSRCSGVIIGIIISAFVLHFYDLAFMTIISPEIALLLCILLPVIGIVDWGTQKLQYRKSTTSSRMITGFLIGSAMNLISYTGEYYLYILIVITVYFIAFFLLVFLGNRKEMKKIKQELDGFSSEEQDIL